MSDFPILDEFHARMNEIPEWGRKMLGDMMIKMEEDAQMIVGLRDKLKEDKNKINLLEEEITDLQYEIKSANQECNEAQDRIAILLRALKQIAPHTIEFDGEEIPSEEALIAVGAIGRYERLIIEQEAAKPSD